MKSISRCLKGARLVEMVHTKGLSVIIIDRPECFGKPEKEHLFKFALSGADGGTGTLTIARQILSLVRLPIPPRPQINHSGVFKMEHRCEIFLKRGSGI